MAMKKGSDNVQRLIDAEILDPADLSEDGRKAINAVEILQSEIDALKEIKSKLKLKSVKLEAPGSKVWRL